MGSRGKATLTTLEICAGAGGQALGVSRAGFSHVGLVEIESDYCATLERNRPEWNVINADLHEFDGTTYGRGEQKGSTPFRSPSHKEKGSTPFRSPSHKEKGSTPFCTPKQKRRTHAKRALLARDKHTAQPPQARRGRPERAP